MDSFIEIPDCKRGNQRNQQKDDWENPAAVFIFFHRKVFKEPKIAIQICVACFPIIIVAGESGSFCSRKVETLPSVVEQIL